MDEDRSEYERAAEEMREFEQADELPSDLSQWPDGKDGSVTIDGEEVNADDYKGEPIKSEYDAIMGGGATDPKD